MDAESIMVRIETHSHDDDEHITHTDWLHWSARVMRDAKDAKDAKLVHW